MDGSGWAGLGVCNIELHCPPRNQSWSHSPIHTPGAHSKFVGVLCSASLPADLRYTETSSQSVLSSTVAHKHMLAEMAAWHTTAMNGIVRAPKLKRLRTPIRGWQGFVRAQAEPGKSLRDIGLKWAALSAEDKKGFHFGADDPEDGGGRSRNHLSHLPSLPSLFLLPLNAESHSYAQMGFLLLLSLASSSVFLCMKRRHLRPFPRIRRTRWMYRR